MQIEGATSSSVYGSTWFYSEVPLPESADGGFFVPEEQSAEIWDIVLNPPLGAGWRNAHPWRYRMWRLGRRITGWPLVWRLGFRIKWWCERNQEYVR